MRLRLPDTRHSVTRKCSVGALELYITVGFYDNRQPGEVFVKIAKHGSTMSGLMDGVAVMVSMLLQNDVPWNLIEKKFLHTSFQPAGFDERPGAVAADGKGPRFYGSMLECLAINVREVVKDGDGNPEKGHGGADEPPSNPSSPRNPAPSGPSSPHNPSFPPPDGSPSPAPVGGSGRPPKRPSEALMAAGIGQPVGANASQTTEVVSGQVA